MNIGERIKQLRIENNMSQEKLATAAGITKASISNYERNLRSPQYSALYSIANALGVPIKELTSYTLGGIDHDVSGIISKDEIDDKRPRRVRRLMAAFDNLSNEAQMKLIGIAEDLTLISKYKMSLSESLQRYIYERYLLSYEPYEDTQKEAPNNDNALSLEVKNIRHIILKREVKTQTSYWHFIYYQFECDKNTLSNFINDSSRNLEFIEDIIIENENFVETAHDKCSLVFDDEIFFDEFIRVYENNRANSDVDNLSYGNDSRPKFTFFLINKETREVRLEDETD